MSGSGVCDLLRSADITRQWQQNTDLFCLFKGNILEMFPHFLSLYKSQVHGRGSQVFTLRHQLQLLAAIFHRAQELQCDAVQRPERK